MRSASFFHFVSGIILFATIHGCEKAPTWDELTGDSGTTTPSNSDAPLPEYHPPRRTPTEPTASTSVVAMIQALQPHEITDEHMRQLTSLTAGLEELTELNLERSKVTETGLADIQNLKWLKSFNLSRMPVTADILKKLEAMSELEVLKLNYCNLDDSMLSSLENLTSLRELTLNQTKITDEGFRHFAKLTNLEAIDVSSCAIDGSGFKVFDEFKEANRMKSIIAHSTRFGTKGGQIISGWPALEQLVLSQAAVDDRVMGNFQKCENLRELDVSFNNVSDAGVRKIDKLKHVNTLRLRGNRGVTNASLEAIKEWTELKTLEVDNTSCSLAGVQELKKYLPQALISLNGQQY